MPLKNRIRPLRQCPPSESSRFLMLSMQLADTSQCVRKTNAATQTIESKHLRFSSELARRESTEKRCGARELAEERTAMPLKHLGSVGYSCCHTFGGSVMVPCTTAAPSVSRCRNSHFSSEILLGSAGSPPTHGSPRGCTDRFA